MRLGDDFKFRGHKFHLVLGKNICANVFLEKHAQSHNKLDWGWRLYQC